MPIYSGECSEELASHICNPCPDPNEREFGRVRTSGFIFSDYYDELKVNPTSVALWTAGIQQGKIIVVPETAGSYDPGEPKELAGYGDRIRTYGPRTMTLTFRDPNLSVNYPHYNGLGNQTELIPFFRTSSQLRIFDKPATITAKDAVDDDAESEVVWEVSASVTSVNLPSYHSAATLVNTIFKCSYLNEIEVVGGAGYDTTLAFASSNIAASEGVTAVASSDEEYVNAVQEFSFDKIEGAIGLPQSMTVMISGVNVHSVSFKSEYATKPFSYKHTDGTVHPGVFTSGIVNI